MDNALKGLMNKLDSGEMFCKATDIAELLGTDVAHLRGMALHEKHKLPFASYVIGKNIKFSIPCVLKAVCGEDVVLPQIIDAAFSNVCKKGAYCSPADLAKIFNCDPNTIRKTIRKSPDVFGATPLVSGRRIKVPVAPLIQSIIGSTTKK